MLPSTGLFKSISCPYYHGGASNASEVSCYRPYCHFKHVKKDEKEPKPAQSATVPEYTPAPKLLKLADPAISLASKKKNKLEYRPDKPELNTTSSRRHSSTTTESVAPVYVPSSSGNLGTSDAEEYSEELEQLSEKNKERESDDYNKQNGVSNDGTVESSLDPSLELNIKKEPVDLDDTIKIKQEPIEIIEKVHIKKEPFDDKKEQQKKLNTSGSKDQHREERRDSTASTSSRHKHKSSSSSSKERSSSKDQKSSKETVVRKERDKDSERSKDRDRERDKDKKSTSSSSGSRSKHSSSNPPSSEKHRSSSSSSSKHKSSSSSSKSHSSSKEKSSSSSHSKHKSKDRENSSSSRSSQVQNAVPEEDIELDSDTVELFATTEEDIMKECEMIYDQLEQEFASLHQSDSKAPKEESTLKRKASTDEEQSAAASTQRKRVAYENAEKFKSSTNVVAHKPNHIRNAMQAIYHRQTVLRKKQEEDATAAENALRDAEEKVREANEALRKVKEKNLTPLIPKSFLTPPTKILSRSIAPVANMLALERAKKKVEELKAEKKLSFTPAQTAKGTGRVAHKATAVASSVESEKQPKPPVLESTSTKISFNIRMQYYEMMVKHCLAIYPNAPDAWERAQTEELTVFKKCNTPVIYKSSALLAINKLRKEAADSGNKPANCSKMVSHEVILAGKLAQNTSWSVQKKLKTDSTVGGEPFDKLPAVKAYDMVYDLRLTEEQLISNGYPRSGTRAGTAVITNWKPMRRPNDTERYCTRCGKVFNMSIYDEVCVDECNYHPKSTGYRRGFADNLHRCCQQPAGTPGCTYANYHVSDYFDAENLTGYVSTIDKDESYVPTKKDIYALDCEMCYTTHGIELTRVTVVDINARTVYDALVKPDNKIVDYNTVYSGITEQMLANETRTLRDVQAILMSMFHSKTVLVGHSLESDLKALKLIHSVVVDTSVLFPHKMGPPKKRALKTLCIENLKRIIQENEAGHDSAEDAEVCIQLVKFYLRNKIS